MYPWIGDTISGASGSRSSPGFAGVCNDDDIETTPSSLSPSVTLSLAAGVTVNANPLPFTHMSGDRYIGIINTKFFHNSSVRGHPSSMSEKSGDSGAHDCVTQTGSAASLYWSTSRDNMGSFFPDCSLFGMQTHYPFIHNPHCLQEPIASLTLPTDHATLPVSHVCPGVSGPTTEESDTLERYHSLMEDQMGLEGNVLQFNVQCPSDSACQEYCCDNRSTIERKGDVPQVMRVERNNSGSSNGRNWTSDIVDSIEEVNASVARRREAYCWANAATTCTGDVGSPAAPTNGLVFQAGGHPIKQQHHHRDMLLWHDINANVRRMLSNQSPMKMLERNDTTNDTSKLFLNLVDRLPPFCPPINSSAELTELTSFPTTPQRVTPVPTPCDDMAPEEETQRSRHATHWVCGKYKVGDVLSVSEDCGRTALVEDSITRHVLDGGLVRKSGEPREQEGHRQKPLQHSMSMHSSLQANLRTNVGENSDDHSALSYCAAFTPPTTPRCSAQKSNPCSTRRGTYQAYSHQQSDMRTPPRQMQRNSAQLFYTNSSDSPLFAGACIGPALAATRASANATEAQARACVINGESPTATESTTEISSGATTGQVTSPWTPSAYRDGLNEAMTDFRKRGLGAGSTDRLGGSYERKRSGFDGIMNTAKLSPPPLFSTPLPASLSACAAATSAAGGSAHAHCTHGSPVSMASAQSGRGVAGSQRQCSNGDSPFPVWPNAVYPTVNGTPTKRLHTPVVDHDNSLQLMQQRRQGSGCAVTSFSPSSPFGASSPNRSRASPFHASSRSGITMTPVSSRRGCLSSNATSSPARAPQLGFISRPSSAADADDDVARRRSSRDATTAFKVLEGKGVKNRLDSNIVAWGGPPTQMIVALGTTVYRWLPKGEVMPLFQSPDCDITAVACSSESPFPFTSPSSTDMMVERRPHQPSLRPQDRSTPPNSVRGVEGIGGNGFNSSTNRSLYNYNRVGEGWSFVAIGLDNGLVHLTCYDHLGKSVAATTLADSHSTITSMQIVHRQLYVANSAGTLSIYTLRNPTQPQPCGPALRPSLPQSPTSLSSPVTQPIALRTTRRLPAPEAHSLVMPRPAGEREATSTSGDRANPPAPPPPVTPQPQSPTAAASFPPPPLHPLSSHPTHPSVIIRQAMAAFLTPPHPQLPTARNTLPPQQHSPLPAHHHHHQSLHMLHRTTHQRSGTSVCGNGRGADAPVPPACDKEAAERIAIRSPIYKIDVTQDGNHIAVGTISGLLVLHSTCLHNDPVVILSNTQYPVRAVAWCPQTPVTLPPLCRKGCETVVVDTQVRSLSQVAEVDSLIPEGLGGGVPSITAISTGLPDTSSSAASHGFEQLLSRRLVFAGGPFGTVLTVYAMGSHQPIVMRETHRPIMAIAFSRDSRDCVVSFAHPSDEEMIFTEHFQRNSRSQDMTSANIPLRAPNVPQWYGRRASLSDDKSEDDEDDDESWHAEVTSSEVDEDSEGEDKDEGPIDGMPTLVMGGATDFENEEESCSKISSMDTTGRSVPSPPGTPQTINSRDYAAVPPPSGTATSRRVGQQSPSANIGESSVDTDGRTEGEHLPSHEIPPPVASALDSRNPGRERRRGTISTRLQRYDTAVGLVGEHLLRHSRERTDNDDVARRVRVRQQLQALRTSTSAPLPSLSVFHLKEGSDRLERGQAMIGHVGTVLHVAVSPRSTFLVSIGADEKLRLWNVFMKRSAIDSTSLHSPVLLEELTDNTPVYSELR